MNTIRKVSIGADYKNSMNYVLGQPVLGDGYTIHLIWHNPEKGTFEIFVEKNGEVLLWKEIFPSMPITVEYNIDF